MDRRLSRNSRFYPRRLDDVSGAPARLFVAGELPADTVGPWVAIVGARAASGRAIETSALLAAGVARAGGIVVSGGAIGVDAAAHRSALAVGGKTVVVMASGLGHRYPAVNRPLFAEVAAGGGALVTPFEAGVPPRRYHFVRRNRIIAALCDAVVVVSAERASGSLYTAIAARDYGRALASVPGTPGCEALIAEGAFPTTGADELLAFARGEITAPEPAEPENDLERAVLGSLTSEPTSAEALAASLGSSARDVDRALVSLELARLALAVPGRAYVRSRLGGTIRS